MRQTRQLPITLDVEKDSDVLAWLDAQDNRTEAIRRLIRAQMERENG